jgi:hypothetical protein
MSDVSHALHRETEAAKTLLAQMADIIGDDEDAKRDLVEGETNLRDAIALTVQQIGEDEAALAGLGGYIDALKNRAERIKQRRENMRTAIAVALEMAHEKKIETAFGTVTLRAASRVAIVTEESEIPSQFWKPQPPKLDKSAVTKALKDGQSIPGATLSNGGNSITIRRD